MGRRERRHVIGGFLDIVVNREPACVAKGFRSIRQRVGYGDVPAGPVAARALPASW